MRRQYDCELAFDALRFYADKTGERVTTAKAQRALESLRQHNPAHGVEVGAQRICGG